MGERCIQKKTMTTIKQNFKNEKAYDDGNDSREIKKKY